MWFLPLDSGILSSMDVAEGFALSEDEDFVYLTRHAKIVAIFSAGAATKRLIQEEIVRQYLAGGVLTKFT